MRSQSSRLLESEGAAGVGDADRSVDLVADSLAMRQVITLARRVAKVDSTLLITGEGSAGKERIARFVHKESARAAGPFIALECGALPAELLERQLYGHARGAVAGATQDRAGVFEAANHGTLLLDEVGEVPPRMQAELLRALQEREVRRVGETQGRKVDVRIIASTNRKLAHDVSAGGFGEDLYYRLEVVELRVPPLRDRRDDIVPLAQVLLAAAAQRMGRDAPVLVPEVAEQLLRYAWPGNVRELANAMERAVALARGSCVALEDLPDDVRMTTRAPAPVRGKVRSLEEIEKEYILAVLALNNGNQTHAAAQLGIGSATLYRKLKSYGVIGGRR